MGCVTSSIAAEALLLPYRKTHHGASSPNSACSA
jgi:hypothetical protein